MFLGIDLGSSSAKAMLAAEGQCHKAKAEYPPGFSMLEQPTGTVLQAVTSAVRQVMARAGVSGAQVEAVGLCGHGPSILFADEDGKPLTDILTWQDTRAIGQAQHLKETLPGFEKDSTSYEAKLLWYYNNYPGLFRPGVNAFYPKDYLFLLLCGRRLMDSSTASVVCYYNADTAGWDMGGTGIPSAIMPEVAPSWEVAGRCGTAFSRACGLLDGTPVVPGGIDSFCEAVGAGGFSPDTVVDGSGTSTVLTRSVPWEKGLSAHVLPQSSLLVHMMSSTGGSYQWFRRLFGETESAAAQAALQPEKPVNILYLPYLAGERSPVFDAKATGVFAGLRPDTDKPALLQALYQGMAFAVAQNLHNMGGGIARVRAVGGINRDNAWVQIKANASGLCYQQMDELDAGALGAALLAALGTGSSHRQLETLVRVKRAFRPQTAYQAEYRALLAQYEKLYAGVRESFEGLYLLRDRLET